MSKQPWMPFYFTDFRADTLDLSLDETGTYFLLICLAWHHGDGSVSGDMKQLKLVLSRLCSDMHGNRFNRIVPKLLARYFQRRGDGRFYQKRVEKELEIARIFSRKQSENAHKRWSASKHINGIANAVAVPDLCSSQSHKDSSSINSESETRGEQPAERTEAAGSLATALPSGALARQPFPDREKKGVGEKSKFQVSPYLTNSLRAKGWTNGET